MCSPRDHFTPAWLLTGFLLLLAGAWPCGAPQREACRAPRVLGSRAREDASPVVACDGRGGRELDGALPLLFGGRIDLARADAATLEVLPGVGPSLAAAIVAERGRAPFCAVADLDRVPGIGSHTLGRLVPLLEAGRDARCGRLSAGTKAP